MNEIERKIVRESVKLFSVKGYYGTSMRDIMNAVGCTQPTLYHYFESKHALFRESVLGEFQRMITGVIDDVDTTLSAKDIYVRAVVKRKHFTEYQRQVCRLAILGWYHLLGDEEVENQLCGWVLEVMEKRKAFLAKHVRNPAKLETFASLLMNVYLNLTEQIILRGLDISDEDIDRRFTMLFELS